MPYRIFWIVVTALLSLSLVSAQNEPHLIVVWVDEGNLWFWQQGDTSPTRLVTGAVVIPYIAPDGKYIAFTRGDVTQPKSLWTVEVGTGNLHEFALTDAAPDEVPLIDQVEWLDADTVYFNTRQSSGPFQERQDDLWRGEVSTGKARRLLPPGQGGFFVISPNHQLLALIRPGVYPGQEGSINLFDPSGQNPRELLAFPAISTGSEYTYYPIPVWKVDSSALLVSIPPQDMIYSDDNTLPTAIWRLAIDGSSTPLTTVQSSFFGLPRSSADGQYMTYVRRKGDITVNQFELVLADGQNQNLTVYAAGNAGNISGATWFLDTNQFFYVQGDIGDYWLGAPGQPPQRLAGNMYYPHFVDSSTYVYATYPGNPYELRYARIGESDSHMITTFTNPTPILDAVLVP